MSQSYAQTLYAKMLQARLDTEQRIRENQEAEYARGREMDAAAWERIYQGRDQNEKFKQNEFNRKLEIAKLYGDPSKLPAEFSDDEHAPLYAAAAEGGRISAENASARKDAEATHRYEESTRLKAELNKTLLELDYYKRKAGQTAAGRLAAEGSPEGLETEENVAAARVQGSTGRSPIENTLAREALAQEKIAAMRTRGVAQAKGSESVEKNRFLSRMHTLYGAQLDHAQSLFTVTEMQEALEQQLVAGGVSAVRKQELLEAARALPEALDTGDETQVKIAVRIYEEAARRCGFTPLAVEE